MRRIFRILSAAGLLCLLLPAGNILPALASSPEKVLNLAVSADIISLYPYAELSGESIRYCHLVFDPLVRWNKDMKLEPRLAESWEQIDPRTMRFRLRENVVFHSGNPFTAGDVVWTVNRLKDSPAYMALFEPFASARAVDEHTVEISTHRPYGLVLNLATYIFVLDSRFYKGEGGRSVEGRPASAGLRASGTGPFILEQWTRNAEMLLRAFTAYWGERGNVDRIRATVIKDGARRVDSLFSGAVDMILTVPSQDYGRLLKDRRVQFAAMNSSRLILIQMNAGRRKELADPRVREAIIRATDNEALVNTIMRGYPVAATQQIPPHMDGYNPDLPPRYNLGRARQLLSEAGYANGFSLTMLSPDDRYVNDEKISRAFVNMLAKINIRVELTTLPTERFFEEFDAKSADLQLIGWHPDTEDAANFSEYLLMCPDADTGYGIYNSGNYCNKRLDELTLACQTETDHARRNAMLREIEKIAYDDAAFIPLYFEHYAWAAGMKLKNFREILIPANIPYLGDLILD
ncbi:MAG: ABC transporter substrate-binding protein [Deltaproteobacteria bacterium]|nr:ABC transporter substrate-binding protein [Deltaproteobacteria bacterium]